MASVKFIKQCFFVRPMMSAMRRPTYKIVVILVFILIHLTRNEFTQKTVEQDISFYMVSLEMNSLFTNILVEETFTKSNESIYNQSNTVEGLSKSEFKKHSLATK